MMEGSTATTIGPLLLRNIIASIFIFADKSLLTLSEKHKFLQLLRYILISAFLLSLRLLSSLFSSLNQSSYHYNYSSKLEKIDYAAVDGGVNSSGIARALSQVLSIVSDVPVSSRKYDVVRSLAERLIDENLAEGYEPLRQVNFNVLSAAFSRTLVRLEAGVMDQERSRGGGYLTDGARGGGDCDRLNRVMRAARYYGDMAWARFGKSRVELDRLGVWAEKMAAELLWLAEKLVACGFAEEAVCRWASASNLAWLALSAEPRLQGSLVKVSGFLFKQAKDMGAQEEGEESKKEQQRQTKMKMLMSWLPLLCRASNGTDAPVLSFSERADLEKALEEMIEAFEHDEQEKVLSLWLHHFTYCPSSDWPNLHACYARWCTASRKVLLFQYKSRVNKDSNAIRCIETPLWR